MPENGWTLPEKVNPERICVQLYIPNDFFHIAAFWGAILSLTYWFNWRRDGTQNAKAAAAVWWEVFSKAQLDFYKGCPTCDPISIGTDGNEDFMIRQNPDNPCILESSVNGTEWCQWADLSLCNASLQPAGGSPQPPTGGCVTYNGQLQASSTFLIPTTVSSGDTVEITSANGATNDPDYPFVWNCPDGSIFFGGACIEPGATTSTDPIPTIDHMRLIYLIGSTYYDAMAGVFTVPSGIANEQITLQVNDSVLAGDNGTLSVNIKVCRNTATTWSHTFELAELNTAWDVYSGRGVWDTTRWKGVYDSGSNITQLFIRMDLPAGHYTGFYTDQPTDPVGGLVRIYSTTPAIPPGSPIYSSPGANPPYTFDLINPGSILVSGNYPGNIVVFCSTITLSGVGVNPF